MTLRLAAISAGLCVLLTLGGCASNTQMYSGQPRPESEVVSISVQDHMVPGMLTKFLITQVDGVSCPENAVRNYGLPSNWCGARLFVAPGTHTFTVVRRINNFEMMGGYVSSRQAENTLKITVSDLAAGRKYRLRFDPRAVPLYMSFEEVTP